MKFKKKNERKHTHKVEKTHSNCIVLVYSYHKGKWSYLKFGIFKKKYQSVGYEKYVRESKFVFSACLIR